MEYEDSEYNSYEDDFETPEVTDVKESEPQSKSTSNRPSFQYSFKDLSYKKSSKSNDITKSTNRPTSTLKLPKKTYNSLLQENKDLRSNLRQISEELTSILSTLPRKTKSPRRPAASNDPLSSRLQIYINEYVVLQNKVNKITNPEYLISLKNEIKEKELKISSIDKEIKLLKKKQKNRDKNLEKFWTEDFAPNELTTFGHMNEQLFQFREMIQKIEMQEEKDRENYEKLQEKEEQLVEKVEKLQEVWNFYISQGEDIRKSSDLQTRYEAVNRNFEGIKGRFNSRITKLQFQEKSIANEIEAIKKEAKTLEISIEIKEKEANLYMSELSKIASTASSYNMDHLVSLVKINKSESTSDSNHGKSPSPDPKKRKHFDELFKEEAFPPKPEKIPPKPELKIEDLKQKMKGNGPTKKNEDVIEEYLPEEEESFQPIVKKDKNETKINENFIKPLDSKSIKAEITKGLDDARNELGNMKNKPKSLLQELEESSESNKQEKNEKKGTSFFTELETASRSNEKNLKTIEKSSIFNELEASSKDGNLFKPIEKSSFLNELETSKKEEISFKPLEKSSFFNELESNSKNENVFKPIEKSSFLDELEINSKKENSFKPIEKSPFLSKLDTENTEKSFKPIPKSSFLDDLEPAVKPKEPVALFKPIEKSLLFSELEPDTKLNLDNAKNSDLKTVKNDENTFWTEPKLNSINKPRGRDRSHLFSKKEEINNDESFTSKFNFLSPEKKPDEISDFLTKGRNDGEKPAYLAGGILDKMKSMAERAEKHDFFGGLYDKNEEVAFTSKLLPTRFDTNPSVSSVPSQPNPKPSKPSAFFELVEEDINL